MKTKICFVMKYMIVGGVEKSLINLCKTLDPEKFDITVLLLCNGVGISNELPGYVNIEFISRFGKNTVCRKNYNKFLSHIFESFSSKVFDYSYNKYARLFFNYVLMIEEFFFMSYVKKCMKKLKYDYSVGYIHGESSYVAVKSINALNKITFCHFGSSYHYTYEKTYYGKSDKVIAVSNGVAKILHDVIGVSKKKIEVIYNIYDACDIKGKCNDPCELDFIDCLKIVTVARVYKEKGIKQAIETANIIKNTGYNFKWFIVGPFNNDSYYNDCMKKISEFCLEDYFILIGSRENPFPYYRSCDIYVQPSESEALCGSIIEASLLNKAIVSTDTIGGKELIKDEFNGLICECNAQSISDAVIKLIENPDLKQTVEKNTDVILQKLKNTKEEYYKLFSV